MIHGPSGRRRQNLHLPRAGADVHPQSAIRHFWVDALLERLGDGSPFSQNQWPVLLGHGVFRALDVAFLDHAIENDIAFGEGAVVAGEG